MTTAPTDPFSDVSEVTAADFDYLTTLREQLDKPTLAFSAQNQQAVRRLYVRMFVTLVESTIATFRDRVLENAKGLSFAEYAVLRETNYEINDKGIPVERPLHSPLLSSIRFAFRMLAKTHELKFQPDYSAKGWQDLQEVVRIRNRLTHPKTVEQMRVTNEEMEKVDSAEIWFMQSHKGFLDEHTEKIRRELDEFRRRADA